jgi:hypothetical protein
LGLTLSACSLAPAAREADLDDHPRKRAATFLATSPWELCRPCILRHCFRVGHRTIKVVSIIRRPVELGLKRGTKRNERIGSAEVIHRRDVWGMSGSQRLDAFSGRLSLPEASQTPRPWGRFQLLPAEQVAELARTREWYLFSARSAFNSSTHFRISAPCAGPSLPYP